MTNPTPEQYLALARECMPDEVWHQTERGPMHFDRDGMTYFRPKINPAHAWAVFKWWFANFNPALDARVVSFGHWDSDKLEESNVSAAFAVLARLKGTE